MKIFNIVLSTLLTLSLVLILGAACYYVFIYVVSFYKELGDRALNLIHAALAVGLLAMLLVSMIAKRLETRTKRHMNFPRKSEIYRKFITTWASLIRQSGIEGQDLTELGEEMENIEKEFILLASPEVVKKYIELQSDEKSTGEYPPAFGEFILELRRDLGNVNSGLQGDDLAALFFDISQSNEAQDHNTSVSLREASVDV